MGLTIIPLDLRQANAFVAEHHRHHGPVRGCKFCLGVLEPGLLPEDARLVGVAIVGRPVARALNDGYTAEVTRLATDGTRNACSILYAAAWRAARAIGYRRLLTYTLEAESGASLRAAGWKLLGARGGGNWNTPARPRVDTASALAGQKNLWEQRQ